MYGNITKIEGTAALGSGNIARQAQASETQDMPEVAREHSRLSETVDGLSNLVSMLIGKLQPVMHQRPSAVGNSASTKEQECSSPLGQSMASATASVRRECERLHELLHALAV